VSVLPGETPLAIMTSSSVGVVSPMRSAPNINSVSSAATASSSAIEGRGRSVLIADDHEDTRLMLKTILEMNRFSVLEAADGEEAVMVTERERPDIVLMDFSLPILDGLSAFRLIRANQTTCDVPVIFLSGRAEPAPQQAVREAGCDDFLIKPFDLKKMVQLIERRIVSNA
jgi:two-component system, OmpR family, phosphate regulon response regulator PhoB